MNEPRHVELHCRSNFSFLEGASHPEDLAARAAALGAEALALTDRDNLCGVVRFEQAARESGLRALVGAEVTLDDATRLVLLARDRDGYRNLSRLLTLGARGRPKGEPCVSFDLVASHAQGLLALTAWDAGRVSRALLRRDEGAARAEAGRLADTFGREHVFLEVQRHLVEGEDALLAGMASLSKQSGLPLLASNGVLHATRGDKRLHDVLTSIREHVSVKDAGVRLLRNAEHHLRPASEMAELFAGLPGALDATLAAAEQCTFKLDELRFRLPRFPVPEGETAFSYLHRLVHEGARRRYQPITPAVSRQIAHELDVIERLDLAGYFLVVWEIVEFCRANGILCQGRGSAANSSACYCLGITAVDPIGLDLLFERFLSDSRREPPDIDLDIAHAHREKVIQHVYERYGRDRAAMTTEVISFRARSALRDVGKALGLAHDEVERLSKALGGHRGSIEEAGDTFLPEVLGSKGSVRTRVVRDLVELCRSIDDFPRHLGIHVGGMVISREPIDEVVPVVPATMPGRTVIQWNKDDAAAMGLVKIDLLGLGMLTLLQDAIALVEKHHGERIDLARIPTDDPATFQLLQSADTVGVFQVESRAQMNTLPRMKPKNFHDLVVEVALIRPGPIQGEMVHPYLRRRAGEEPVTYPHPSLEPILARTLGVPLFQEQGMKLAIAAGGFTPTEADDLRRAMTHSRAGRKMQPLVEKLGERMAAKGFTEEARALVIKHVESFANFGFAESHAASFALLVLASAWMKVHYPVEFTCAIFNAQPMGFYSPATIADDARRRGVKVLPVDVNRSTWDARVETPTARPRTGSGLKAPDGSTPATQGAVRLGFRSIHGFGDALRPRLERAAAAAPFETLAEFARVARLPRLALENLAAADGFASLVLERRQALWEVGRLVLEGERGPLFVGAEPPEERERPDLLPVSVRERTLLDYQLSGVGFGAHPISFARELLKARGGLDSVELQSAPTGRQAVAGGLVICRQRPQTAKGTTFMTLEDERGFINVVVRDAVFVRYRTIVRAAVLVLVKGKLERNGAVLNIVASHFEELPLPADGFESASRDFH